MNRKARNILHFYFTLREKENDQYTAHYFYCIASEYRDVGIEKKKLNLLHCGQLLDDKQTLQSMPFPPILSHQSNAQWARDKTMKLKR